MKKSVLLFPLLLVMPFLSATTVADVCKNIKKIDTGSYAEKIGDRKVTFVALDYKNNNCLVIHQQGLTQRHGPFSTFKIPHTLIALESGAVKSIDELVEWDQVRYPAKDFWPKTWKQSHSLATAFKHSAVWYYQALVPRIEPEQYKKWLARFHYGNQAFTPGSNQFWLNGELKISAVEQIEFINCLLADRCGVSINAFSAFESVALQEVKNGLSLYAKTGAGSIDPNNNEGAFEGWYVGYIKNNKGQPVTAFAIYVEAPNFTLLRDFRRDFALALLADSGLWTHN